MLFPQKRKTAVYTIQLSKQSQCLF